MDFMTAKGERNKTAKMTATALMTAAAFGRYRLDNFCKKMFNMENPSSGISMRGNRGI